MARTPLFTQLAHLLRQGMNTPMTRRRFLKGALAATALAAALPYLKPAEANTRIKPVPIIGAGLAGLVTAYALSRRGISCRLFEASGRLGGRVYTRRGFNREGMYCELGGELVDTGHESLISLCQQLNVPLEPFEAGDQGLAPSVCFADGKVRTEDEVLEALRPLAQKITADLDALYPDGDIRVPTYRQPFSAQALDNQSLSDYLAAVPGLEPWLRMLIEIAYVGEYGLEASQQSALNLLLLIGPQDSEFRMFGDSDEAMRIRGGGGRLVEALVRSIQGRVPIHTGYELTKICKDEKNEGRLRLTFQQGNREAELHADHVIFALPFTVLRTVEGLDGLGLSEVKRRCIHELGYGTNSKQMIGFHSRFWRESDERFPANAGAWFTDWQSQTFWETSRLQKGSAGILTNFLGGEAGRTATAMQWRQVLEDMKPVYPKAENQHDGQTAFFNWSRFAFARGSYACPKPGQYTSLVGSAHEPELHDRLFFAGEHCSVDSMGYMNGAVESGLRAAALYAERAKPVVHHAALSQAD